MYWFKDGSTFSGTHRIITKNAFKNDALWWNVLRKQVVDLCCEIECSPGSKVCLDVCDSQEL